MTDAQFRDEAREKTMTQAPQPMPRDLLTTLLADFESMAASKENRANDLENEMLFLRAEATGLRHAAVGVREALDTLDREVTRSKEFIDMRDGADQPVRKMPIPNHQDHAVERAEGRW